MLVPEVLFWGGLALLFYTYLGYPAVLFMLNKVLPVRPAGSDSNIVGRGRSASILIAAYNEEKVIEKKLRNCLDLEYPAGMLDIWVASDGSTDRTNETVKAYTEKDKRIHLLEFPRTGKSGVLNKAMDYIKSEIVVFSDANTEYAPDALRKLISHFSDEKVGCVCGRLIYRDPGAAVSGRGEGMYWRYETFLKRLESKRGYVAGANGAIYAIRRELFMSLPPGTINDDFTISMQIVRKGFRCIYAEEAVAYEAVAPTMESEFKRHVRDGAGHYISVWYLSGLLNPFLGTRAFIYWSHRIFRWAAPFILVLLLLLNVSLLGKELYQFVFVPHLIFYLFAIAGLMSVKGKKMPIYIYVPFYFCNLNLALLAGFFKAVTGRQKMTWERTERIG